MRPIVREFCEERGIPYREDTLYRALASVGGHLGDMTAAYARERRAAAASAATTAPAS